MDDRAYNNAFWEECLILLRLLTMHREHRFLRMLRSEKHTTSNCENNFHFERLRLKPKTLLSYSWKKMSTCAFSSLWKHHRQPWRPALHTHTWKYSCSLFSWSFPFFLPLFTCSSPLSVASLVGVEEQYQWWMRRTTKPLWIRRFHWKTHSLHHQVFYIG